MVIQCSVDNGRNWVNLDIFERALLLGTVKARASFWAYLKAGAIVEYRQKMYRLDKGDRNGQS